MNRFLPCHHISQHDSGVHNSWLWPKDNLFGTELRCLALVQDKFYYDFCVCLDLMNIVIIYMMSILHLDGLEQFNYGNLCLLEPLKIYKKNNSTIVIRI